MARELAQRYQGTLATPGAYYYLNTRRAEIARAEVDQAAGPLSWRSRFGYGVELLNAGATEDALRTFERLLAETGGDAAGMTPERRRLYEMQAVAYLRLGEQQNCILNHTAEACILPLRGGGIHTRQDGSRQAIAVYQKLLDAFRQDYQSRWLLNVAAMTLGHYPASVPDALLIPGLEGTPGSTLPRFRNVAANLGVAARDLAGGVSVEDFNNDGFLDLFATSFRLNDPVRFFLNDAQGGFVDATEAAGLAGLGGGLNIIHGDYNNDGYADVFILRGAWLGGYGAHPNSLLKNNGDGTFEDVTYAAGLGSEHPTQTAAWGDFNNDGWLDLFVGNEASNRWLSAWQDAAPAGKAAQHRSELFVNNGDGTFTDVAAQTGIDLEAFVKGVAWGDVNNDGYPDLYVSVIGGPNRLYINRGGTNPAGRHFEEAGGRAGVHEPFFSFPAWFWDYDNDGWEDLFVAGFDLRRIHEAAADVAREYLGLPVETEMPRLYRNNGDETFTDVTEAAGLNRVLFAMGSNYGDLDNDGFPDVYIGTGAPDLRAIIPNRMFHNREGRRFDDVTFDGGFGHLQKGHGVAFADFDQDGDQDIYAVMGGVYEGDVFQNTLFENPGNPNAWITLRLEGRHANRSALGARIQLTVTHRDGTRHIFYQTVSTGGSFGASSLQQETGLGPAERIDALRITWPNRERTVEVFTDLAVNRSYRIVEGAGQIEAVPHDAVPFRTTPPHPAIP